MRILILILAFLAGVATELLAQDCGQSCGTCCQELEGSDNCDIRFPSCGDTWGEGGCGQESACNSGVCNSGVCGPGFCGPGFCDSGVCNPEACDQGTCNRAAYNQGGCNGNDCDPYTYYQLREDWRRTHGPILDSMRWLHKTKPPHHAKHNGNGPARQQRAKLTPWHGNYYYPQWGGPVALVVPPTAEFQSNYSWGVPASRISPIDAQFSRNYPGPSGGGAVGGTGFLPPPLQPSDTNQFGVYYVRGPW